MHSRLRLRVMAYCVAMAARFFCRRAHHRAPAAERKETIHVVTVVTTAIDTVVFLCVFVFVFVISVFINS